MRVAAYARVSTSDKNQDPETQLLAISALAGGPGSIGGTKDEPV